jgi:hypothetical protein
VRLERTVVHECVTAVFEEEPPEHPTQCRGRAHAQSRAIAGLGNVAGPGWQTGEDSACRRYGASRSSLSRGSRAE